MRWGECPNIAKLRNGLKPHVSYPITENSLTRREWNSTSQALFFADLLDKENPCLLLLRDLEEQQGLKSQTGSPNGSFIRGAHGVRERYGTMHAPYLANRYFRNVIHCKASCSALKAFNTWKKDLYAISLALTELAILVSGRQRKAFLFVSTSLCLAGV
jgi:hypothetical protein